MISPGGPPSRRRAVEASRSAYRALLRAYPEDVREMYGEEMVGCFADLCRDELRRGGTKGLALLWVRTLPELVFTALEERNNMLARNFARNAYLTLPPGVLAQWGGLSALSGGVLGTTLFLIGYSHLGWLGIGTDEQSGDALFVESLGLSLLLFAISLSSLGLLGLHGAMTARSGRPGRLAGAGAAFAAVSAVLWAVMSWYVVVSGIGVFHEPGSYIFVPFAWMWPTGILAGKAATLCWFAGYLLLGIAVARERLPVGLRVLPLAVVALVPVSSLLAGIVASNAYRLATHIILGFDYSLPFVGMALLGWALFKCGDVGLLAVQDGPAQGSAVSTPRSARVMDRIAGGVTEVHSGAVDAKAAREKELLKAVRDHGEITVAGAALETSLSVEEADSMLSALAAKGHLEVRVEEGRLLYSLWKSHG